MIVLAAAGSAVTADASPVFHEAERQAAPVYTAVTVTAVPVSQPPAMVNTDNAGYSMNQSTTTQSALSLTFDDGFSRESTAAALDILKKYDIKCTFFITGHALKGNPDLWKRAVGEGHQVCNHTKTHRFLKGLPEEAVKKEIEGWEKYASSVLGDEYISEMKRSFPYIRLPGGSGSRDARLLKTIGEMSYIPVGWSTETVYGVLRHYPRKKGMEMKIKADIISYVLKTSGNGSIILLHLNKYDVSALEDIIVGILERDCRFVLLSDLTDIKKN